MIVRIAVAVLVLLVSYVGFIITNTPAAWVIAQARPQLAAAQASLGDVHGSAWRGNAELSLEGRDLGRLYWKTSLWPLIAGNLDANFIVKSQAFRLNGSVAAGGKKTYLRHIDGQADLSLLAQLLGIPAGLKGTLVAKLDKVVINSQQAIESADGSLVAHGVRIPDLGVGLGNVTLDLRDGSSSVKGRLDNSGGDIALAGTLTLTKTGAYVLQATLKPQASGNKQNRLRDGLTAILGTADASGRFHYRSTGRLALQ